MPPLDPGDEPGLHERPADPRQRRQGDHEAGLGQTPPSQPGQDHREEPVGREEGRGGQERRGHRRRQPEPGPERAGRQDRAHRQQRDHDPDSADGSRPWRGQAHRGEDQRRPDAERHEPAGADRRTRLVAVRSFTRGTAGQRGRDQERRDQQHREQQAEGPSPAQRRRDQASVRGPEQAGQRPGCGPEREQPGALSLGVDTGNDGERHRVLGTATRAFDQPPDDEGGHPARGNDDDGAEGEDDDAGGEGGERPEALGDTGGDRQGDRTGQHRRAEGDAVEPEPAEVPHHSRQDGDRHERLDREQRLHQHDAHGDPAEPADEHLPPRREREVGPVVRHRCVRWTTRASTATAPAGPHTSGFTSIAATASPSSQASTDSATIASVTLPRSAAG